MEEYDQLQTGGSEEGRLLKRDVSGQQNPSIFRRGISRKLRVMSDSDHPTTSIIKSDRTGRTRYTRQYKQ